MKPVFLENKNTAWHFVVYFLAIVLEFLAAPECPELRGPLHFWFWLRNLIKILMKKLYLVLQCPIYTRVGPDTLLAGYPDSFNIRYPAGNLANARYPEN